MKRRTKAWVMAAVFSVAGIAGAGIGSGATAEQNEPTPQIEYGSQDDYGYPPPTDYYPPPTDYYPPPTETPPPPTESPSPSPSPTPLPHTGSESFALVGIGMGLIALGLVAWLLAGRRRRA